MFSGPPRSGDTRWSCVAEIGCGVGAWRRVSTLVVALLLLAAGLTACGSGYHHRVTSTAASSVGAWVDSPVTFVAGGMTVSGTFRHRSGDQASAAPTSTTSPPD